MIPRGMSGAPLVSIDALRVEFPSRNGPVIAVKNVDLQIFPGEVLCLVGESGSGKSVTAGVLMQLTRFTGGAVTGGSVEFARSDGVAINLRKTAEPQIRRLRGNQIGMIFQEPMVALNPAYTVGWQLAEGLKIHRGLSGNAAIDRSLELLREVLIPEPERRLRQYPHELSGGMCQRIVIAMALACEPRLLIADEPTTALDVTVQAEILTLIDMLRRRTGTAVLLITHDMAVVAQMAERVAVMYRGEIVEEGPVGRILRNPQHTYTRSLLSAVPRIGEMAGSSGPRRMKMAETGAEEINPPATSDEHLLEVTGLSKRFPIRGGLFSRIVANVHAVEDVSFFVRRNETLSLVGESGSGKTTVGRCILRLEEPDLGSVQFNGQDLLGLSQSEMRNRRRNLQVIFQDPYGSLNPQMRLFDQVAEPIRNFGLGDADAMEERVVTLFDRVRLPRRLFGMYPSELSGGQRQRVAIARALAVNPDFIVADEAVSSLDVSVQARVLNLMMELQADLGLSYLFVSHDMAVVERVSHRVAVMYLGRIVEIGPREEVFEDPRHPYTKALLAAVPRMDPGVGISQLEVSSGSPPSLIGPVGHQPEPSRYEEVSPGHLLLLNDIHQKGGAIWL